MEKRHTDGRIKHGQIDIETNGQKEKRHIETQTEGAKKTNRQTHKKTHRHTDRRKRHVDTKIGI